MTDQDDGLTLANEREVITTPTCANPPLPEPPPGPSAPKLSPAHDVFRRGRSPLEPFFWPRTVALIGATETPASVGRTLLHNLIESPFRGEVFPVNPKREWVLGLRAYPSVGDVPAGIDLAVVATPAPTVPGIIRQCSDRGVPAAIVISAGFREGGPVGTALEREVLREARRGGMRVIGPNCLGVMAPATGLNATFAAGMAKPGRVAFLSQSGALLTAVLDWSRREEVGFSALVSVGSMVDVGWGDLIDYFGEDPDTGAIVLYMESIGDARSFLSAAREVALTKPIVVIKAGRGEAASRAAACHTGALTGSDAALDAAFRRAGVLRVDSIGEVFDLAELLSKQPRPEGPRLTIVTNAGGPGVLATDSLVENGGQLASLSEDTRNRLDALLPAAWSHGNPIDVLGDAPPERFAEALAIAASDPKSDGVLAIVTPQDMTDPTRTAQLTSQGVRSMRKPVLASWMGGASMQEGIAALNLAGIPTFAFPDSAARAFCHMWRFSENLRYLYETPTRRSDEDTHPKAAAAAVIAAARAEGRTLLDEAEAKSVIATYGIPTVPTLVARTEEEAADVASTIGFPVVVKVWSRRVTHKTDVKGVRLGVTDRRAVIDAFRQIRETVVAAAGSDSFLGVTVQPMVDRGDGYEVIMGGSVDPQLGPVLMFGAGGEMVEVLRDRALALPPLTAPLARRLIEGTRVARALRGVRGRPAADLDALEAALVRFADLLVEQRWIKEIDVNPLLATAAGVLALDARIVLHPLGSMEAELPRSAIRSYPTQYVWNGTARNGASYRVRPIRPEDEPMVAAFHRGLGEETVRARYLHAFGLTERTAHARLLGVCFADYDREMVLVAENTSVGGEREIIAIGRLSRDRWGGTGAELALLVADSWQYNGIGQQLLQRLVEIGREEGLKCVHAHISRANVRMQRLCARLGFSVLTPEGEGLVTAALDFDPLHDGVLSAPQTR